MINPQTVSSEIHSTLSSCFFFDIGQINISPTQSLSLITVKFLCYQAKSRRESDVDPPSAPGAPAVAPSAPSAPASSTPSGQPAVQEQPPIIDAPAGRSDTFLFSSQAY